MPKVNSTQSNYSADKGNKTIKDTTSNPSKLFDIGKKNKATDKKEVDDLISVTGSIIKELVPSRVIKLFSDGVCYGYYYLDITNEALSASLMPGRNALINTTNFLNQLPTNDMALKSKAEILYELIFKNLIGKINND
jgi:hypothetical protein